MYIKEVLYVLVFLVLIAYWIYRYSYHKKTKGKEYAKAHFWDSFLNF